MFVSPLTHAAEEEVLNLATLNISDASFQPADATEFFWPELSDDNEDSADATQFFWPDDYATQNSADVAEILVAHSNNSLNSSLSKKKEDDERAPLMRTKPLGAVCKPHTG